MKFFNLEANAIRKTLLAVAYTNFIYNLLTNYSLLILGSEKKDVFSFLLKTGFFLSLILLVLIYTNQNYERVLQRKITITIASIDVLISTLIVIFSCLGNSKEYFFKM